MRVRWLVGIVLLAACGCTGKKLAPVSGVVKLNGKPLAHATVSFVPVEKDAKSTEAPLASSGKTNENGEYKLETLGGQTGALVGKHKVSISLLAPDAGERDGRPARRGAIADSVPARYNTATTLEFDVTADGTTRADFLDLKSP